MKNVLLWLVRLFGCAVGFAVLLWCGASLYFLIAGRYIAPPDLSAYELPHPVIPPAEDAVTYIKDYARNAPSNLNWRAAQVYLRGTTNRQDCVELVSGILAAESNAFRCAKGVIASSGSSVPSVAEYAAFLSDVCLCNRITQCYRLRSVLEAESGDRAAGRATLLELFRLGGRLVKLDDPITQVIGDGMRSVALTEMGKPLFAPDEDEAWLAELQKMTENMAVGDVVRAKRSIQRAMALAGAGYWGVLHLESILPGMRVALALNLNWFPGYAKYAAQNNRTLAALKDETEHFCAKLDLPYDVEYARRFRFGHFKVPAPQVPVNPLVRNWIGHKTIENFGFGGAYCMLFRRRFSVRSQAVVLACRRYRARHGRYPEKLNDLVPAFLAAVPRDPFDGQPLRYNNEHHYVWTVGEKLAFDGNVDFTKDGRPMWSSTMSRDYMCVRFLSPEGGSDAGANRPIAYYVPGWLRTGSHRDASTWTSFTNIFSSARCENFAIWNGNAAWRTSLRNADSQWRLLANEIERMPSFVRTNVTLVGHSLGARIVVRTLADLAGKGMKVRRGILLGAAIRDDDPDLARMGDASLLPVLNVCNPKDVTLRYFYRVAGGEKGEALGVGGGVSPMSNVENCVVPDDIMSEAEITAAWGKFDLLRRIASHHALFYLSSLRKWTEAAQP